MHIAERPLDIGEGEPALAGLTDASLAAIRAAIPGYTRERGTRFREFRWRIETELLNHGVITANRYTAWFSKGEQNECGAARRISGLVT
ncbi:MAG: hypothetical protein ACXWUH_03590 [Burkholderiales bacterium]